jgi:hypothetical protein
MVHTGPEGVVVVDEPPPPVLPPEVPLPPVLPPEVPPEVPPVLPPLGVVGMAFWVYTGVKVIFASPMTMA